MNARLLVVDGTPLMFDLACLDGRLVKADGQPKAAASGHVRVNGKPVAVVDDITRPMYGAGYQKANLVGGRGMLQVRLVPNQFAPRVCINGHPVVLKGGKFSSSFLPTVPATAPPAPPDPATPGAGTGAFIVQHTLAQAG